MASQNEPRHRIRLVSIISYAPTASKAKGLSIRPVFVPYYYFLSVSPELRPERGNQDQLEGGGVLHVTAPVQIGLPMILVWGRGGVNAARPGRFDAPGSDRVTNLTKAS